MSLIASTSEQPAVAIIGIDGSEFTALENAAEAAGARVVSRSLLSDDDPSAPSFADVTVVDVGAHEILGVWDALRRCADQSGASANFVIRTSLANVDSAMSAAPDADLVVGYDPLELQLALAGALERSRRGLTAAFDVASDEGLRLQRLADEIGRIARTLVTLPEGLGRTQPWAYASHDADGTGADGSGDPASLPLGHPVTASEVRGIIRLRRLRDRHFSPELFADPAWDMLLDLAAARIERVRVAVSSLCIAAAVPPTTALRWIKAMTDRGLFRRVADPHDARRIFIELSDEAATAMNKYLRVVRTAMAQTV